MIWSYNLIHIFFLLQGLMSIENEDVGMDLTWIPPPITPDEVSFLHFRGWGIPPPYQPRVGVFS